MAHRITEVSTPVNRRWLVGEPSVAVRAPIGATTSTAFVTHNFHAARSVDSGTIFSPVDPRIFPQVDGGFCCDQRAVYSPEYDITIWYLQYNYSATTGKGSVRIAVADGNAINAGSNGTWYSYLFFPASFGFGSGYALDFPDLLVTDSKLYLTSYIYDGATENVVDTVIWKVPLHLMKTAQNLSWTWWLNSNIGGADQVYRFAQGSRNTMRAASHMSATSIRLFRNSTDNSNQMYWVDRTIPAWGFGLGRGVAKAYAPNGQNWLFFTDQRITGGYANEEEYGFMWTVPQNGTSRPLPYIRVARFSTADHSLLGSDDIWSDTVAYAYPACATNLVGDVGLVAAYGEGNGNPNGVHPSSFFATRDHCSPTFTGNAGFTFSFGASSPNPLPPPDFVRWGDYFTVQQDPVRPMKFCGTGMSMAGGGAPSNQRIHYVQFGREKDYYGWVSTSVRSSPVSGVPISVNPTDKLGKSSVVSGRAYVSYDPNTNYVLTAPRGFTSGGRVYAFEGWRYTDEWRRPLSIPTGGPTLTVNNGTGDDRAEAVYEPATQITVGSINPGSGINIQVTRADALGNQSGLTQFVRYYRNTEQVRFTAPAANGLQRFNRWYINGAAQTQFDRFLTLNIGTTSLTIEAEYCSNTQGSFTAFGTGCVGSNGRIPLHNSSSSGDAGTTIVYEISDVQPNSSMALFMGTSNTVWSGTPLPLSLGFIGLDPTCSLLVDPAFTTPFGSDGTGRGTKSLPLPAWFPPGTKIYTHVHCLDLGVSSPLKATVSGGLELVTGGDVCR